MTKKCLALISAKCCIKEWQAATSIRIVRDARQDVLSTNNRKVLRIKKAARKWCLSNDLAMLKNGMKDRREINRCRTSGTPKVPNGTKRKKLPGMKSNKLIKIRNLKISRQVTQGCWALDPLERVSTDQNGLVDLWGVRSHRRTKEVEGITPLTKFYPRGSLLKNLGEWQTDMERKCRAV